MFESLGVSDLACHILDVRAAGQPPVVSHASPSHISAKRVRRALMLREVSDSDSDRNIYVNELLPKDVYELLKLTRRVAREQSYRYV